MGTNITIREFAKELEGSKKVFIKQDLIFVWTGGHTVNVYSALTGISLDCFNVGDFKYAATELSEVEEGINDYIKEVA